MPGAPRSSIDILQLGPDDWMLWRKLRLEALGEAPDAFSSKLADWQGEGDTESRWRTRLSAVPFNIVSYLDSTSAGMVSATAPEHGTVELISMWVAPFARGRSVGDALLAAVKAWAAEQEAARISLAVFETNAHAIAFYRRHGFTDSDAIGIGGSRFPPERTMVWNRDPKSTAASA